MLYIPWMIVVSGQHIQKIRFGNFNFWAAQGEKLHKQVTELPQSELRRSEGRWKALCEQDEPTNAPFNIRPHSAMASDYVLHHPTRAINFCDNTSYPEGMFPTRSVPPSCAAQCSKTMGGAAFTKPLNEGRMLKDALGTRYSMDRGLDLPQHFPPPKDRSGSWIGPRPNSPPPPVQHNAKQASKAQQLKDMEPAKYNTSTQHVVHGIWFRHNLVPTMLPWTLKGALCGRMLKGESCVRIAACPGALRMRLRGC